MFHHLSPELCEEQGSSLQGCGALFSPDSFCFWWHHGNQTSQVSTLIFHWKTVFFSVGRERGCLFSKPSALHSYLALPCGTDSPIIMTGRQEQIQGMSKCSGWSSPSVYCRAATLFWQWIDRTNVLLVIFREKGCRNTSLSLHLAA